MSTMDILEFIRAKIIKDFPDITDEELIIRLTIAENLLEKIDR